MGLWAYGPFIKESCNTISHAISDENTFIYYLATVPSIVERLSNTQNKNEGLIRTKELQKDKFK
jgi:hypothetical protein